jgi:hypothetical protein
MPRVPRGSRKRRRGSSASRRASLANLASLDLAALTRLHRAQPVAGDLVRSHPEDRSKAEERAIARLTACEVAYPPVSTARIRAVMESQSGRSNAAKIFLNHNRYRPAPFAQCTKHTTPSV